MESRLIAAFTADVGRQKPEAGNQTSEVGGRRADSGTQPSEDVGEEAEVAAKVEPSQSTDTSGASPPPDDEGYVWPEGSAPTEAGTTNESSPEDERAPDTPLPSLDELVTRIPPAARATLDELFRARFVSVKRVEKTALKS